jgi:hypothetical protein
MKSLNLLLVAIIGIKPLRKVKLLVSAEISNSSNFSNLPAESSLETKVKNEV